MGRRSWRVIRSQRARPPKKDATSPTRSATASSRVSAAAGASVWHRRIQGDLVGAAAQFRDLIAEAHADADANWTLTGLHILAQVLAYQGDTSAARTAANAAIEGAAEVGEVAAELGEVFEGGGYLALAVAALAAGDVAAAEHASGAGWRHVFAQPAVAALYIDRMALVALAAGDLVAARRWADDAVAATTGWHLSAALTTRARVAIAQGEPESAERDAHEALATRRQHPGIPGAPDALECLAALAVDAGSHREAARLFGAADAIRQRIGQVRFKIYDAGYAASVEALRDEIGDDDFDGAWAEGAALSTSEAIAYAQRGRGERKRPTSGWASLTPTERDVGPTRQRRTCPTRTSPQGFSSHAGPWKPTSPTSTPNSA